MSALGPCQVPNWEKRLEAGEGILPDPSQLPFFDYERAEAGWDLFSSFRLVALEGMPRVGDVTAPWLRDLVKYWMGAQHPDTGARSVPEMLLLTAKKSTKTSSMALLTLAQFVATTRPNAKAVIMAPTLEIANMAFDLIRGAIEQTPKLCEIYKITPSERKVSDLRDDMQTELKVEAADLKVLGGTQAQFIMLDELHLLASVNGSRELMQHVRGARRKNPAASLIICSTHPHYKQDQFSIWEDELSIYRKCRNGEAKHSRLFVGYEFPKSFYKDKKHLDPKYWHMANPNIGFSETVEELLSERSVEADKGPLALGAWDNQFLNVPPEENDTPNSWSGAAYWDDAVHADKRLGDPTIKGLDYLLSLCESVVIGVDGGGMYDLLSLYVIGRQKNRGPWLGWGHSWAHERMRTMYPVVWDKIRHFVDRGELSIVDYSKVAGKGGKRGINLHELSMLVSYIHYTGKLLPKDAVGIDPGGLGILADSMKDPTLPCPLLDGQIRTVGQGTPLATTHEMLGQRVAQGNFKHGGQSIMRWAVKNVIQTPAGNSFKVEKEGLKQENKIDPYIAMICAARMFEASPEGAGRIQLAKVGNNEHRDRSQWGRRTTRGGQKRRRVQSPG